MKLGATCFALCLSAAVWAYPDGAPPAHTGGFGEAHCGGCHFGETRSGSLVVSGLPERYIPGNTYELKLKLLTTESVMAGFQLSIRSLTDGGQAGELYPAAGQQKISSADVLYLTHTEPSVISQAGVTWDISWTAPEGVPVPVVLHAAAVAGNDDESPLGDSVHLLIQKLDHSDGLQQENP